MDLGEALGLTQLNTGPGRARTVGGVNDTGPDRALSRLDALKRFRALRGTTAGRFRMK